MLKSNRLLACAASLVLLALFFVGCGYRPMYRMYDNIAEGFTGEPIPIYMAIWNNDTSELGLETTFYNTVSNWLQGAEQILLKKAAAQADYVLSGTIRSIDQSSNRGTVRLTVEYSLKDRESGAMVWTTSRQLFTKSFNVTDDAAATHTELQKALAEIADDLGEKIYVRFLYALKDLQKRPATGVEPQGATEEKAGAAEK